jgi:protocatechuate 3,4-dioxygenase beta subunit
MNRPVDLPGKIRFDSPPGDEKIPSASGGPALDRRNLLKTGVLGAAWLLLISCFGERTSPADEGKTRVQATPDCGDPTRRQTEGPFYTPNSPRRASLLEPGFPGTRLVVTGRVLTEGCLPVAGAVLDFWHADDRGEYDNSGYRLRGHQFSDDRGHYRLETIVPGLYPGRTRHIHVKVKGEETRLLTTQLYFPDERRNLFDFLFTPSLLMAVENLPDGSRAAHFDFVLKPS